MFKFASTAVGHIKAPFATVGTQILYQSIIGITRRSYLVVAHIRRLSLPINTKQCPTAASTRAPALRGLEGRLEASP